MRAARPVAAAPAADGENWASEFWSGLFAGSLPGGRRNAAGYRHPGDLQDPLVGTDPGTLEIAFTGPGVKLLCLRRARPHPWIAATGFHQSCRMELRDVRWDPDEAVLSPSVVRRASLSGLLIVAGGPPR